MSSQNITRERPRSDARRNHHRTATFLLSLAWTLVTVVYIGSLVSLSLAVHSVEEPQSWSGRAPLSAMIAAYAVIAAFVLAFTAAVRSDDTM
jgi:heme/copper-type cytochrome/quinol oxidase subunit 2